MPCAGCRTGEPMKGYVEGDTFYLQDVSPEKKRLLWVNAPAGTHLRYYKIRGRQYMAGGYIQKLEVLEEDLDYMLGIRIKAQPAFFQASVSVQNSQKEEETAVLEGEEFGAQSVQDEESETNSEIIETDNSDDVDVQDAPKKRRSRKKKSVESEFNSEEIN